MFEYTFDPITQELEVVINLCKLDANLVYTEFMLARTS